MNRRRLASLMLSPWLAISGSASAQTAIDGPRGRFDDDLISQLAGDWRISRQIRGTTVENTARASWVLNHQFLQLHMKDVAEPPRYEAIVLIGFVHADQQYLAYWTDTYGAKFAGVGRGRRSGNAIEFRFDYDSGPFFNTFSWFPEKKQWVFRMESQNTAGARQLFAVDTLTAMP